jgi:hypothetical protein
VPQQPEHRADRVEGIPFNQVVQHHRAAERDAGGTPKKSQQSGE